LTQWLPGAAEAIEGLASYGGVEIGSRTRIKVLGAVDKDHPLATSVAECPTCGDKQNVYACRILYIMQQEDDQKSHSQLPN